jgi:signal transduction histidine kinase
MRIPGFSISHSVKRDLIFLPALFLFNIFQFSSWTQLGQVATKPWLLLVWLYGLLMLVPLAWRDRAPRTIFVVQCVLTVAAWPLLSLYVPVVGIPVALYAVSIKCGMKTSLLALLTSLVPNGLAAAVAFRVYYSYGEQIRAFTQNGVFLVLVTGGAWALGRATGASKRRVQDLERENMSAQEAAARERIRIAAELHDIVCHAVTLMVLQAAGASRVAKTDPAEVIPALENIESAGNQAMTELQRLLGVLRRDGPTDAHTRDAHGLEPQPGLANLPELLTSFSAAGSRVTLHVEGTARELDRSVDLTAYRIVQEGVTNVLRHGDERANPQVRLVWQTRNLLIQIDNGINLAKTDHMQTASGGRGLVGLRERVQAVGGELEAGPRPGAGYRLTAALPLATRPAVAPTTVPCDDGR